MPNTPKKLILAPTEKAVSRTDTNAILRVRTTEAARLLGISTSKLRELVKVGAIPADIGKGERSAWLFSLNDLHKYSEKVKEWF